MKVSLGDPTIQRTPLEPQVVLFDRFEIQKCLGMGGFCCTYLAWDKLRECPVAVRELFPDTASRLPGGYVDLGREWTVAHELRRRFIAHSTHIGRIHVPGNLPVIAAFEQLGTAYSVSPFIEESSNLRSLITESKSLDSHDAKVMVESLLKALDAVHQNRLHHDIRPSNILYRPGQAVLIDPGAAREWEADRTDSQMEQFLVDIAAPEVLKTSIHRGPASDLYALCASIFSAILPNISRTNEEATPLELIEAERPDLPKGLKLALDRGLRDSLRDRAKSAAELISILQGNDNFVVPLSLADFDSKATLLKSLRFQRRQCPACQIGILEQPKPLKPRQCPACREGFVRLCSVSESRCPTCRDGKLAQVENQLPNGVCPYCRAGILKQKKGGLLKKETITFCAECNARFEPEGDLWRCTPDELDTEPISKTAAEWLADSGRSKTMFCCKACGSQFDQLPDGRRIQKVPESTTKYGALYPEQWARIASHLPATGGNAECDSCGADFVLTDTSITLINVDRDPYHSCDLLVGRHLSIEELRWLGVGKSSKQAGFVCSDCGTEFDVDQNAFKLVHSSIGSLRDHLDRSLAPVEWHRIGRDLPESKSEAQFLSDLKASIIEAYVQGEIGLEHPKQPSLIWEGPATRITESGEESDSKSEEKSGKLSIKDEEISFGGLIKKWKAPFTSVQSVEIADGLVRFKLEKEVAVFKIEPVDLSASLQSGFQSVQIEPKHLVQRLKKELAM